MSKHVKCFFIQLALFKNRFNVSFWPYIKTFFLVSAKLRLNLRKNATRIATTKHYDWALLKNTDIRDEYLLELRNLFETLQEKTEKGTPNDEYENFVNAHLEAVAKCIRTKPRIKYRVPCDI